MKKIKYFPAMLFATLLMLACGTTTYVTGSYKAPGVDQVAYKKVFLSPLTDNTAAKQKIENGLAQYLNSKGIAVVKSSEVFPPDFHSSGNDKDKNVVLQKIHDTGCDAIFTIALVNKETETRYVPGNGVYPSGGIGYYGTFGAYYAYGYGSFYSSGYYTTDKIYYLETNLYDANTEKLVWSAQSKTYDPTSMDSFLEGYEKAISQQVVKDGLVKPAAK